ncbi:MAG TPA: hypothetical protein VGE08_09925 [Steroidobacter sp.]
MPANHTRSGGAAGSNVPARGKLEYVLGQQADEWRGLLSSVV